MRRCKTKWQTPSSKILILESYAQTSISYFHNLLSFEITIIGNNCKFANHFNKFNYSMQFYNKLRKEREHISLSIPLQWPNNQTPDFSTRCTVFIHPINRLSATNYRERKFAKDLVLTERRNRKNISRHVNEGGRRKISKLFRKRSTQES